MDTRQCIHKFGVDQLLQKFPRSHHFNFGWTRLEAIFSLYQVRVDSVFLEAAIHCWDSTTHCFDFGGFKVCPTIEEFAAIMGKDRASVNDGFIVPLLAYEHPKPMCELFNMSTQEVLAFCPTPARLSLGAILDLDVLHNDLSTRNSQVVLCFCILAVYFLISAPTNYYRLVHVVTEMGKGLDPYPLILAETLCGLDQAVHNNTVLKRGSPLLLQIWLQERLSLVVPPPRKPRYRVAHYRDRNLIVPIVGRGGVSTVAGWELWFGRVTAKNFHCVCPWWDIGDLVASTHSSGSVFILSFTHMTFYFPDTESYFTKTPRSSVALGGLQYSLSMASKKFYAECWDRKLSLLVLPPQDQENPADYHLRIS